jgi:hypothetical protein
MQCRWIAICQKSWEFDDKYDGHVDPRFGSPFPTPPREVAPICRSDAGQSTLLRAL